MNNIEVPPMIPLEELAARRKKEKTSDLGKTFRSIRNSAEDLGKKKESYKLQAVAGVYEGAVFPLDGDIVFGRGTDGTDIVYPADTPGISRRHCMIRVMDDGQLVIKDLESSAGTFLADGTRLSANVSYRIKRGECFYLASKREIYKVI